ncbi:hypothetical protein B0H11DRAFT_1924382 [Mycena galericulata]|nr:hypothetical protein B0H11DRAFT_1924382 [Mycena galericulata]
MGAQSHGKQNRTRNPKFALGIWRARKKPSARKRFDALERAPTKSSDIERLKSSLASSVTGSSTPFTPGIIALIVFLGGIVLGVGLYFNLIVLFYWDAATRARRRRAVARFRGFTRWLYRPFRRTQTAPQPLLPLTVDLHTLRPMSSVDGDVFMFPTVPPNTPVSTSHSTSPSIWAPTPTPTPASSFLDMTDDFLPGLVRLPEPIYDPVQMVRGLHRRFCSSTSLCTPPGLTPLGNTTVGYPTTIPDDASAASAGSVYPCSRASSMGSTIAPFSNTWHDILGQVQWFGEQPSTVKAITSQINPDPTHPLLANRSSV